MSLDKGLVTKLSKDLSDKALAIRTLFNGADPPTTGDDSRLVAALRNLGAVNLALMREVGSGHEVDFADFFSKVGTALVSAQRNLDAGSEQYLNDSRAKNHVLPSVFRIPKISADIRFAWEDISSNKLNLVFFQEQTTAQSMHQQQVSFEIVSVPAPVEARDLAPYLELVLAPGTRKLILDAASSIGVLTKARTKAARVAMTKLVEALTVAPNRIIILINPSPKPLEHEAPPPSTYFLITPEADGSVSFNHFTFSPRPTLAPVYPTPARNPVGFQRWAEFLTRLADRQAQLLGQE